MTEEQENGHENSAAEYVLGTLDADERSAFERLLARDPALRAAVKQWEERLAPLTEAVREVAPPSAVWERIEKALPPAPTRPVFELIQGGRTASGDDNLRRSRNRWRGFAVAAGALAASLLVFVADREFLQKNAPQQSATGPSYVAVVNRGGDQPALIVRVDFASGNVYVRPVSTETPAGHSLELWYIGEGRAPKSMGLVDKSPINRPIPQGANSVKASFAVTVEPEGGSPTGGPTGPIVYSGQMIRE
jgi:anti-sigma-K factor RskA